jgi:hypothetical protein
VESKRFSIQQTEINVRGGFAWRAKCVAHRACVQLDRLPYCTGQCGPGSNSPPPPASSFTMSIARKTFGSALRAGARGHRISTVGDPCMASALSTRSTRVSLSDSSRRFTISRESRNIRRFADSTGRHRRVTLYVAHPGGLGRKRDRCRGLMFVAVKTTVRSHV